MDSKRSSAWKVVWKVAVVIAWWLLFAAIVWAEEEAGGEQRKFGFIDVLLLPKIWIGAIFCAVGLVLLMRAKVSRNLRLVWLAVAFVAFGVLGALPVEGLARGMGLHPSPVCAITRPFQFVNAGRPIPVAFFTIVGVISVLSIAGNKLFCGWVCPLGAIQEIPQRIKLPKKVREKIRITLPFKVTNTIRVLIFIAFLPVVFTVGRSIYDYFNPFEFFHWKFGTVAVVSLAVTLVASVFVFRPFCYLACPIGLWTWVLEHFSLVKIRVDKEGCDMCEACLKLTNCPSVAPALEDKKSRPDCHACGQCITACPKNALRFR